MGTENDFSADGTATVSADIGDAILTYTIFDYNLLAIFCTKKVGQFQFLAGPVG
jgi:hypothetical protein